MSLVFNSVTYMPPLSDKLWVAEKLESILEAGYDLGRSSIRRGANTAEQPFTHAI